MSNEEKKKQVKGHFERTQALKYCNDPEFSDRIMQRVSLSLIRNYTVCHATRIFWIRHGGIKLHCLNFRIITSNFSGVTV